MNSEKLMNAISKISDSHIEEFAVVQRKTHKTLWSKVVLAAACLGAIFSAILLLPNILKHEANTPNVYPYEIIWGDLSTNEDVSDYISKSTVGTVTIADSLKILMENRESDSILYAVLITETTGKTNEHIYNTFVNPLNVREEYLDYGIIYITKSQINTLLCPSDMAIILSPALKPAE